MPGRGAGRVIRGSRETDEAGITPFQALTVSLASRVGTGNLAGVAGTYFIAIAIFLFAFTSIIGNYSYAENALTYLGLAGRTSVTVLRLALLAMVLWGSVQTIDTVFETADASMGLMATINLIAIVLLSGTVVKLTRDYFSQRSAGMEPMFRGADYPELGPDKIDQSIWRR